MERRLAAIMAADVVGYSRLMGEDEAGTLAALKAHRAEFIDPTIAEHRGRIVKLIGDGALVEFASVVDALECAVAIQRGMSERNAQAPAEKRIAFRIGINLGDVIVDGDDIYGNGVNVAARLEALAEPGGICISGRVLDQVEKNVDVGYAFLGPRTVKNIERPVNAYKVLFDPADAGKVVGAPKAKEPGRPWLIAAVVALFVAAGGAGLWYHQTRPDFAPASVAKMAYPLPDKPSIAVLPFENLSKEPDAQRFSDGISENIITVLSKVPELFVIARNTSFTYKGKPVKVQQVAEDLGVRYVLEGSLQKEGERIRVTAQLVDALNGKHLWTETYDRTLHDFFAVQDEITLSIVKSMQLKLVLGEISNRLKQSTDNIQVWELVTKGEWYFRKTTKENNAQARALFKEALELDPGSARAYAYLGWTHVRHAQLGWGEDPERSLVLAEEFAGKALAIDDTTILAHLLLGRVYGLRGRYDDAIAAQERAIEFAPSNPVTWVGLALTKLYAGYPEATVALSKKAERLYPTMPASWLSGRGVGYYLLGRYEDAISVNSRALARQPGLTRARLFVIASHAAMGQPGQAQADVELVLERAPDFSARKWTARYVRPYKDKSFKEPFIARLLEAGLPE